MFGYVLVFVCNMWKAAGLFKDINDDLQCVEQTNFDDYSMTLFGDSYRQIIGDYTLALNSFNTRKPYAHMDEKCESLAPDYSRSANC
jgi:hypothetical protein